MFQDIQKVKRLLEEGNDIYTSITTGLVLTDDENKWWGGRMEQPKVAICPQCGEVSIYLENVDKLKNK